MQFDSLFDRRLATNGGLVAVAAITCSLALINPAAARATSTDCTAAKAAATLQSRTPFHATYVVTPTTPGSFPTEHHEEIWVDGKMYTLLADKRWLSAPVTQNPMKGFTGPISGFSDCKALAAQAIRGEATTGFDVKMESGRRTKMWISSRSGLPVRDAVDQDILLATLDFDYTNVRAPTVH